MKLNSFHVQLFQFWVNNTWQNLLHFYDSGATRRNKFQQLQRLVVRQTVFSIQLSNNSPRTSVSLRSIHYIHSHRAVCTR